VIDAARVVHAHFELHDFGRERWRRSLAIGATNEAPIRERFDGSFNGRSGCSLE